MIKVGEHITLDFLGVKKEYSPEFFEKIIYKYELCFVKSNLYINSFIN